MTIFKNCTPHAIDLYVIRDDRLVLLMTLPAELVSIRVEEIRVSTGSLEGIETDVLSFGKCHLPAQVPGTVLIVSLPVLQSLTQAERQQRSDLYMPGNLVRSNGKIIGCTSLTRLHPLLD